ncbi:hypothetical protein FB451DRAFT_134552 [Mycena latifolia]|nr:hypothetical protein FB451DRAFT_134552 [Mycena latifolia]
MCESSPAVLFLLRNQLGLVPFFSQPHLFLLSHIIMTASTTLLRLGVLSALLSAAVAHTHMFFPEPRNRQDYQFTVQGANACENERTDLTESTPFFRGQSFEPKWWWNNHDGGFIKFALTLSHPAKVDNTGFLANENIINGQCYTGGCDKNGFDPGNTHPCVGKNVTIPNWVEDGDYVFSFSSIGGFNSDAVPTKQLPLYHNCANIRVQGGAPLEQRPANWVAPFFGGSQDNVNGKPIPPDTCAFKNFRAEPADPSVVNVNDVDGSNIAFGLPDGWAVPGGSPPPAPAPPAPAPPVTSAAPVASAPAPAPPAPSPAAPTPVPSAAPATKNKPAATKNKPAAEDEPVEDNAADEDESTASDAAAGEDDTAVEDDDAVEPVDNAADEEESPAAGEDDTALEEDDTADEDEGDDSEGEDDLADDTADEDEDESEASDKRAILPRLGHLARAVRGWYD